jgi:hypothetical protein
MPRRSNLGTVIPEVRVDISVEACLDADIYFRPLKETETVIQEHKTHGPW